MLSEVAMKKLMENCVKIALSPNEKLIKSTLSQIKPTVNISKKITDRVPDGLSAEKREEIKMAKEYFRGINDIEKLKALEGTDELKKAEALMEAKEKKLKRLSYSDQQKVMKLNREINRALDHGREALGLRKSTVFERIIDEIKMRRLSREVYPTDTNEII
ncbi:MAG: hypothetical protein IJE72_06130 [Clostridia bacterium]|nr:hypothetical protein [Clostridia bacterium]